MTRGRNLSFKDSCSKASLVMRIRGRQRESGWGVDLGAAEDKEEASLRKAETLRDTHGKGERKAGH